MSKLQRILAGLLALQLVLAVIVFLPRNTAASGGQPLLGIKAEDVSGITITDDQGASVKLAKKDGSWVLPDNGDYPAEATKITPLLTDLAEIKTGRRIAQTAASHTQLQVADAKFARKVELATAAGNKTLFIGSSAGGQASHVRLAGQDDVYIGTGIASWEVNSGVSSWINTSYVSIPTADISGFKLRNAAGEWTFQKGPNGTWAPSGAASGAAIDANAVTTLVNQLATISMTRPVGKLAADSQFGLTQPAAQAELTYKSGEQTKTTTIRIGTKDAKDSTYAVISSDSQYVVRVNEFSVKDAVERTSFAPATPTPSAAPTGTPAP